MNPQIGIRKATTSDLSAIYELVQELAVYEQAEKELTTSIPYYKDTFEQQLWDAFVAVKQGTIIGTTIFYPIFSTWKGKVLYLEDFIVKERHRRQGVGKSLFDHLVDHAKKNQFTGMRWQVLDWNQPAISFYQTYKSQMQFDWVNCQLLF